MFVVYVIVAIVFAFGLAMSGRAKLVKDERVTTSLTGIGVPLSWFPFLAGCEIAGALGLLVGIFFAPLGIAAAIGTILYFVGAIIAHVRGSDFKGLPAPAVMLVIGVLALIFRLASM